MSEGLVIYFCLIAAIVTMGLVVEGWDRFYDWASGWPRQAPATDIMGQHRPSRLDIGEWNTAVVKNCTVGYSGPSKLWWSEPSDPIDWDVYDLAKPGDYQRQCELEG